MSLYLKPHSVVYRKIGIVNKNHREKLVLQQHDEMPVKSSEFNALICQDSGI